MGLLKDIFQGGKKTDSSEDHVPRPSEGRADQPTRPRKPQSSELLTGGGFHVWDDTAESREAAKLEREGKMLHVKDNRLQALAKEERKRSEANARNEKKSDNRSDRPKNTHRDGTLPRDEVRTYLRKDSDSGSVSDSNWDTNRDRRGEAQNHARARDDNKPHDVDATFLHDEAGRGGNRDDRHLGLGRVRIQHRRSDELRRDRGRTGGVDEAGSSSSNDMEPSNWRRDRPKPKQLSTRFSRSKGYGRPLPDQRPRGNTESEHRVSFDNDRTVVRYNQDSPTVNVSKPRSRREDPPYPYSESSSRSKHNKDLGKGKKVDHGGSREVTTQDDSSEGVFSSDSSLRN